MNLYSDISTLKGVGPKLKEKLNKCGIFSIMDLLLYFPRDYEFVNGNKSIEDMDKDEKQILTCKVTGFKSDVRTKNRKILSTVIFKYGDQVVTGIWFNQPYIKRSFIIGKEYNLLGKFKKNKDVLEVVNPLVTSNDTLKSQIIPKYHLKGDINNAVIVKLINQILFSIKINDNLPKEIIEKYKLSSLDESIRNIHFPTEKDILKKATDRLKFQELFTFSLKLSMLKYHLKNNSTGIEFTMSEELVKLKEKLPYSLTNAQSKVVREILLDQKKKVPMNRLVQGDVGSGKTIVALIAMFNVYKNGYQSVLMAPTEILANQHFVEAQKLLGDFNVDIELLTGSTTNKEKLRIKEKIRSNEPLIVVGTHALIQEDVQFGNLGFIVTDEQHRFGVEQRSKLINKGKEVDCVVMSATPIPRTLALYLYSDLEVSIIDELPPGRKEIKTSFYSLEKRNLAYSLAKEEIDKGRQAYIVCPLIEEDENGSLNSVEKVFNELSHGIFKDTEIRILHGKMPSKEKDSIINAFKNNEVKLLISTTVIEVGVNVPNATIMIIENSERFGLAQLHQLRGRVGRGEFESKCILIGNAKNPVTKRRMEIMVSSNDGFYIAEEDLKIRGSGEMFGYSQSGETDLLLADIIEDINILKYANYEAKNAILCNDIEYKNLCMEILKTLKNSSKYICFN
ncbi:ATP-dependent DNA helicase RecG [Clostridium sp. 'White wine YQ']|uniref:ATP-dependent DNA helicase RecG n=1 Tax=Clostridium sp. 'White wine YQ' TaxID=3027474 RepID=UPI0023668A30|nr:ATP-dependent DNA helicase RecG [Clostridium sp. 'White wine YQ']MDD7793752.1 ATP-dependent DNA helicase RecG [Clostridium sp. 'White wine YQ']